MIIFVLYQVEYRLYRVRSYRQAFAVADILFIFVNCHMMKCSNVSVRMLKYASSFPLKALTDLLEAHREGEKYHIRFLHSLGESFSSLVNRQWLHQRDRVIEPFAIIFWPAETVGGWSNTDGCLLIEQDLIYSGSVQQTNAFLVLCLSISSFFVSLYLCSSLISSLFL